MKILTIGIAIAIWTYLIGMANSFDAANGLLVWSFVMVSPIFYLLIEENLEINREMTLFLKCVLLPGFIIITAGKFFISISVKDK